MPCIVDAKARRKEAPRQTTKWQAQRNEAPWSRGVEIWGFEMVLRGLAPTSRLQSPRSRTEDPWRCAFEVVAGGQFCSRVPSLFCLSRKSFDPRDIVPWSSLVLRIPHRYDANCQSLLIRTIPARCTRPYVGTYLPGAVTQRKPDSYALYLSDEIFFKILVIKR